MHQQGLAPKVIAAALHVDDQTVRHWVRRFEAGGFEALAAKLHPGPRPKLSEEQKAQLPVLLAQPPGVYGLRGELWSAGLIAALLLQRFGVTDHPSHVGQMMHDLGYSQQLPAKQPRERDEQKVAQWKDEHWPRIVRNLWETRATVVFVDEAGFLMNPLRQHVWAPQGQTPILRPRTRRRAKVSVIGGLYFTADPTVAGLLTRWHPGQNVDAPRVIEFLEHLLASIAGHLIVVWDNLPAHRSRMLTAWLQTHPRLGLEALPPYAPDLNPIELIWCMSKYHRLANHTALDLESLHAAALDAVDEVALEQQLLHSCLRHTGLDRAPYREGDQKARLRRVMVATFDALTTAIGRRPARGRPAGVRQLLPGLWVRPGMMQSALVRQRGLSLRRRGVAADSSVIRARMREGRHGCCASGSVAAGSAAGAAAV